MGGGYPSGYEFNFWVIFYHVYVCVCAEADGLGDRVPTAR